MKKKLLFLISCMFFAFVLKAQLKKDGTPDMRFNANKRAYSAQINSEPPTTRPRNYNNGGQIRLQQGYPKKTGTYVSPHLKTRPDNKKWNNINPEY